MIFRCQDQPSLAHQWRMTFCHRVISCHYKRQNQHNNWNSPRETCALWVMYWYGVTLTVTYNYNAAADDRRHILQVNIITFQWWAWSRDQWRRCCASPPPRPPLGSSRPGGGCCRHGPGPGCSRPSCPTPGTWETPLHNTQLCQPVWHQPIQLTALVGHLPQYLQLWKLHPILQNFISNSFLYDLVHSFLNILNSFFILCDVAGLLQQGQYVSRSALSSRNVVSSFAQSSLEWLESSEM